MNVAIAIVDLHVAQRAHGDLDAAVRILHPDVAGNVIEVDLLGARVQMNRPEEIFGVKIIGVEIELVR